MSQAPEKSNETCGKAKENEKKLRKKGAIITESDECSFEYLQGAKDDWSILMTTDFMKRFCFIMTKKHIIYRMGF